MLFNSFVFLFLFLPLAVAGHRALTRWWGIGPAVVFMAAASLVFYGWWDIRMLPIFLGSISGNYAAGMWIRRWREAGKNRGAFWVLAGSMAANLALLGYYKYLGFFCWNLRHVFGFDVSVPPVVLPIGISFYTFVQITYLVDNYQAPIRDPSPWRYTLFVSFFPHLLAGPIVHHRDLMPQFKGERFRSPDFGSVTAGLALLGVGLLKKTAVADNLAPVVGEIFRGAAAGESLRCIEAWTGVVAYSLQIYFDFSGYSDMAIGMGMMFGIRLPLNFCSPYRATGIIDFWRRWHMTLSQFLRDYLYIPLGGNRGGALARYRNLMLTMLIGGLWHGANWTFVVWGGLHGVMLVANHLWRAMRPAALPGWGLFRACSRGATFALVCVAWVFFRAETFAGAWHVLGAMFGQHGWGWPKQGEWIGRCLKAGGIDGPTAALLIGALIAAQFFPNSGEIFLRLKPGSVGRWDAIAERQRWWQFAPDWRWALVAAAVFAAAFWAAPAVSEFIYFQF